MKCYALLLVCGLLIAVATRAEAMDFSFRSVPITDRIDTQSMILVVASGEIRRGDAQRLRQFLVENAEMFINDVRGGIALDSPGGDVNEAIKVAQVLREVIAKVAVAPPMTCASACFFLYVGAAKHTAFPGNALAIHRPRFSGDAARQMSAPQADAAHNAAFTIAKTWLQDQFVPQELIDKLFSLPSTQAYWLTRKDVNALGTRAAWYEEWLLARCPDFLNVEKMVYSTYGTAVYSEESERIFVEQVRCEARGVKPEQHRVISGYAQQLGQASGRAKSAAQPSVPGAR